MIKVLDGEDDFFINPHEADADGIVAVGGDYQAKRLMRAYQAGIFPWPHEDLILWFCPDPRFVLDLHHLTISRSLKKTLNLTSLVIKADTNFDGVIKQCQKLHIKRHQGTWIRDEMIQGYKELFHQGYAHSIEAYEDNELVGGLYGISIGAIFFGESMFFIRPNASKICFVTLVAHLQLWGFRLIDCQAYTDHLARFGARGIPREQFLKIVKANNTVPSKIGPWLLNLSPAQALDHLSLR